jgi:hypothetical protein
MIVAMQNFIPDRRAVDRLAASSEKKSPAAPGSTAEPPPDPGPSQSPFPNRSTPAEAPASYVPLFGSVPDLGVTFPLKKDPLNPFVRPR